MASPLRAKARSSHASTTKAQALDIGEQRIYHVTHVSNLPGILNSGCLLADSSDAWVTRPAVDISSPDNRESRRTTLVAGVDGFSVASYVPFFLSPDATVWNNIRSGTPDRRLSSEARGAAASDFVVLVSTVGRAGVGRTSDAHSAHADIAVTDGDAVGILSRCEVTGGTRERMLRKLRADEDSAAILSAEFLVALSFAFESVSLIGVANTRARDVVKAALEASAFAPKVSVYPPWFQPAEVTEP
ncbi:MAG: DarT ssDNA thymidine ADP-ribosyltransferase family protein [Microbacteriaceae bacterium]